MHANLPVAVHVLLKKGSQTLMIQRANTGFKDGEWSLPAGRLDEGESLSQAARREAKEEVGVEIDVANLKNVLTMHHKDPRGERLYFFFSCDSWNNEPKNMESDKCGAVSWLDDNELPENTVDHIKNALDSIGKGYHYVEYGFTSSE